MNVILKQNVDSLGAIGDIVKVKDGYARNYLIPKGLAMPANAGNINLVKEQKRAMLRKSDKEIKKAEARLKEMNGTSLTATVKVADEEQMYGSVTATDIQKLMSEKGFDIEKKEIILEEPIKSLGVYSIPIRLHHAVEGKIKLWVIKE